MKNIDWNAIRDFLAVVRTGTLTGAAARLGVDTSTVGRRIETLERQFGFRLFQRAQTGYFLTDEGQALIERAEALEAAGTAFAAVGDSGAAVEGRVRLATSENHANLILLPALRLFLERHPQLQLEFVTGNLSVNLQRFEADLALRLVRPERGNLSIKKVGIQKWGLYGSGHYLAANPWRSEDGLRDHRVIAWNDEGLSFPAAKWMQAEMRGRAPKLSSSSLYGQMTAAVQGIGLVSLPRFMGDEQKTLHHLPSGLDELEQDIWLVTHSDLRASARIKAVSSFVEETVKAALRQRPITSR